MENSFTIELRHTNAYEFLVKFDLPSVQQLSLDEPAPLGHGNGPNASRILVAAVANCLSASLLYCLEKDQVQPQQLTAQAKGDLIRDAAGHLRIGQIRVTLSLTDERLLDNKRLKRCMDVFQDYCLVTESVRQGIPVAVQVLGPQGGILYEQG